MESKSKWIQLGGRVALGAIFLISGLGKGRLWSDTAAHAASKGVPEVLLAGAVALELLGAAALLLGLRTRWGAAALVAFLVPVTLVFHDFWNIRGGRRRKPRLPVAVAARARGTACTEPGQPGCTRRDGSGSGSEEPHDGAPACRWRSPASLARAARVPGTLLPR